MDYRKTALALAGMVLLLAGCDPNVVNLPSGDVVLTETKLIGAADSGKTFRGASDGSTRISGGVVLSGWTDRGNGIWGVKLPKDADGKPLFTETLFVNGRRAQRSRYPADGGFFRVMSVSQSVCQASFTTNRIHVNVRPTETAMKLLAATPKDELPFAQLIAHIKWDVARYPIVDVTGNSFAVDGYKTQGWNNWGGGDYYVLENVRGAFTRPGQWFYDGKAGEILYRPLKDEVIREALAPKPGLETLVAINCATNVTFENVTFAFTAPTGSKVPTRLPSYQAAASVSKATVMVDNSTNIVFRNCRFIHTGNYAIWFRAGCRVGGAYDCEMTDLGAGGVRIGTHGVNNKDGVNRKVPYVEKAPWMTSHITLDNCEIAHGGKFHPAGVGVLIANASDCSVTHNDIYDLFYTGVSVGWVWGYSGSPSQRNTIAFNHIHDIGQKKLADMGGIYLLGTAFGTRVANNVIHDIHTYSYGGWGLYPDEGSEGVVLENNLVYNTDDASFHQHYGRNNILRNNILLDSRSGQIAVTRAEPHRSMTVEHNIVIWRAGDAFNHCSGTRSEKSKIDWRSNLWWRVDGKDVFNGTPFAEWQKRVKDVGSVFADPGFTDWQKRDFTLKPDSPALKIGFKPFDPSLAGRRKAVR